MKRVAIFAHYDKDNLIENYVIYYISELSKLVDDIIFVSDSNVEKEELLKLENFVKKAIIGKHGEYDFGSYKRGYIWAKENLQLEFYDELIFCNDSCYGPIYPFEIMFNKMSSKDVDFWGVTENPEGFIVNNSIIKSDLVRHIQSYFLVFKPQIFLNTIFDDFIIAIKKEKNKEEIIIKYEQGLSQMLFMHRYKSDVYCQFSKKNKNSHVEFYKNLIIEDNIPLVKTSVYRSNNYRKFNPNYKIIKKMTDYNINLIKKDVRRNKRKMDLKEILASIFSLHNSGGYKVLTIFFVNIRLYRKNRITL